MTRAITKDKNFGKYKSLILYSSLKYGLKYNKTNINTICSFKST